ncbi:7,8-didemethyl-8-hydroxy-5-deazariboflavin synthase subunit CofG [Pleurocapsales cyanobacterium LEGE 10410]|nr:7,8-didemethyl-8-hydroxy-5-deazariboflavin synthase subunit CofG [Pleurocapsales cyanobacterium LEGE 10410]
MNFVVTYSPAYTVVPTYECFNRCSYCNFRVDIGQEIPFTLEDISQKLQKLSRETITEILVLSGEVHPLSTARVGWLSKIYETCKLSLSLGFLPHTNVGPLSWQEMKQLKQVNVSMGLMLEQLNPKFMETVHQHAPSKKPKLRLQQLEWAGKLKIPFTTGLLLGIGETRSDVKESLQAIAAIHRKWGHIQEVILQPHSVGSQQESSIPSFDPSRLPEVIAQAKKILPDDVGIQIPPNLVPDPNFLLECLAAGATDLGGISPIDEVNPDYPHPTAQSLTEILQPAGWTLKPRLPVYPQYYSWLPIALQQAIIAKKKS